MEDEVQAYLKRNIRHVHIVFSDGEVREYNEAYFDYKKRLIQTFQKGDDKPIGIIPLEAVKEVRFIE